ncbi:MAG: exodeoxyribonuclease VII small subunit [Microthrixaceae bacterium]
MNEDNTVPNDTAAGPQERPAPSELGFAGCIEELDRIVRGLETDAVDVDQLADTVTRAADLVEWCRSRLGDAETRLEEVLPRLDLADDPDLSSSSVDVETTEGGDTTTR